MKCISICRDHVDPTTYGGGSAPQGRKCYIGLVNDELNRERGTAFEWRDNPAFALNGPIERDSMWIVAVSAACYRRDEETAGRLFAEKGIVLSFDAPAAPSDIQREFEEMIAGVPQAVID